MNTGKMLGIILIAAGLGVCLIAALWLGAGVANSNYDDFAAPLLGLGIALIIAAPLAGIGVFILIRGKGEEKQMAYAKQERELLGVVQAHGQVDVAQAALELDVNRDTIKEMIYDLVHKGFFAGYINWDEGMLYSQDASKLKAGSRCPNCQGELELAGKGVVRCPYCGTEIFLTA